MAERGSWPSIQRHGLLSTSALLDLYGVRGPERDAVEAQWRPGGVVLSHPALGRAVVRDQKPMDDASLRRCLDDGLEPADWYRLLNSRVFFWLSPARLHRLLGARAYRDTSHEVLHLDTAPLVAAYRDAITLSPINSGATRPFGVLRGLSTFLTVAAYPYAQRRATRPAWDRVVELAVSGGVPDVSRFVRRVALMHGDEEVGTVWKRPPQ